MGVMLALASAVCYGLADVAGGLLSRRWSFGRVALVGQLGGLAVMLAVAPFVPAPAVSSTALGWGALSGVGTGVGMVLLYRGMAHGAMSVVVPVSAVGGTALPVLAGVLLLGEQPSRLAWVGVAAAVPALWLVSRTGGRAGPNAVAGAMDGLGASVGIAVQYFPLALAAAGAGWWPLVAGRVTATLTVLPVALRSASAGSPPQHRFRVLAGAAGSGVLAAAALTCYQLATRQQLVVVAVVLSSLYPVIPVLLGVTVLRERLTRWQRAGLLAAAAAVVLLTVS
ncbi:EamA family transporter [Actinocatenispora rupis]|uniref:Multidrug transporter n=1 Tax=Actinocatenispora rupis TaxID=519421 RepID=A0A8J3J5N1_9ACTN|nr:EamA family transporter [Actinocatenispora rupis]GID14588.1 multidrug transporter [Actinocatenispora rupis]